MEIVVSNKNYENLNKLRIAFIESYLNTNVEYSCYEKIGSDSQLLTIDIEEDIDHHTKKEIMKLLEKINFCHILLYKGFGHPLKQLKSMNKGYNKILNYKDVYYYDPCDFSEELILFAHEFVKMFQYNYIPIKLPNKQITTTIIMDQLGLVPCRLENSNGRLYLEIDGEKHHMDYKSQAEFIYKKMEESDLEPYYKIDNNIDKMNVMRLSVGNSPISAYYPTQSTSEHTFKLTMAFIKLCKQENLPMLNCRDISTFSRDVLGFEYYTINNVIKLKDMYETINVSNFKEHEFEYLENTLAFSIYLSGFGIKHFVLFNKDLHIYTVCYVYSDLLDPYVDIDDMKQRVVDYYGHMFQTDRDHIENKKFKHMSIQELLSCVAIRDTLLFDKHNINHINPYDHKPLPISYYDTKKHQTYGIYNIGNIIKGILKKPPVYDRYDLEIRDVSISLVEGTVKIHGVEVATNMYFTDNDRALKHIYKIWKKGYFLNTMGLMYYLETGDFEKQTIKSPEWFTFHNSSERDLYRFLSFNDL